MFEFEPRYDLPASFSRDIGRIIVRYAYLEHHARIIIYHLLNIDPKQGRIAIREPDLPERIEIIAELCHLHKLSIDDAKLIEFKEVCQQTKSVRDLLAHGMWSFRAESAEWFVQMTRGTNPKTAHDKRTRHDRKRKLKPVAIPFDQKKFHLIYQTLGKLIVDLADLQGAIDHLRKPSPKKPPSRPRSKPSSQARKPKARPAPQRSSAG